MGIITKQEILSYFAEGKLIENPRKKGKDFDVEAASYDLAVGTIIWRDSTNGNELQTVNCIPTGTYQDQPTVTLKPGQMMFAITSEDINMPTNIAGSVFSRNKLSREGILALNAGHIDPGYQGPLMIRLINLRNLDYTLRLSEPIFTIVFHCLDLKNDPPLHNHGPISRDETIRRAQDAAHAALSNALHDPRLTRDLILKEYGDIDQFVKKNDLGSALLKWIGSSIWRILFSVISIIAFLLSVIAGIVCIPAFIEMFSKK